ncbi:MAG: hypothetical protein OM95_16270 [Bdellovibrio sp. ArHS]|nr:MAG: hypothetical protein OM95_16270 [Bdellovibrio sp. ArHS]
MFLSFLKQVHKKNHFCLSSTNFRSLLRRVGAPKGAVSRDEKCVSLLRHGYEFQGARGGF